MAKTKLKYRSIDPSEMKTVAGLCMWISADSEVRRDIAAYHSRGEKCAVLVIFEDGVPVEGGGVCDVAYAFENYSFIQVEDAINATEPGFSVCLLFVREGYITALATGVDQSETMPSEAEPISELPPEDRAALGAMFHKLIADQQNKFQEEMFFIHEKIDPDWTDETEWESQGSLEDAKEIAAMIPPAHIKELILRYEGDDTPLAKQTELSMPAMTVVQAWEMTGRSLDEDEVVKQIEKLCRQQEGEGLSQ